MRKPLGPKAMDRTVRFRLTDEDLEMLRDLAEGGNLSGAIRGLILAAHKKKHRKRRRIS
jgi:hypothetical protein